MRAVALHEDVVVVTSAAWKASGVLVRSAGEAFLIDCPILPDELEALPALAREAGFAVRGLLATHVDWDHVLGRYAFPEASLAVAETSAARLAAQPGAAQRELRDDFDDVWYVSRPAPLSLPGAQALPVPGVVEIGSGELRLHPADGHTADGMAIEIPWAGVLACGDYLSPVEIPMISPGGSIGAYRATLRRFEPLVAEASTVIPGHGGPIDSARAAEILEQDLAYLDALESGGAGVPLPEGRRTREQRRIHAENAGQATDPR